MQLSKLISEYKADEQLNAKTRPYFNHSVEFKKSNTVEERTKALEKVGLNVFGFPAEMITGCDFLSDSGTTTMTNKQWGALHLGDESYGSNRGYFELMNQIRKTFGDAFFNDPEKNNPNAFIFHQGRACENALFSCLARTGKDLIIPSNGHFDTTEGNIENNHIKAVNLFSPELKDIKSKSNFKGNMDILRLKKLIKDSKNKIPLVFLTITNNTGGGQPVSLENIKEVSRIVHDADIPLFFDACRFAENAWFIQKNERGYNKKEIIDIVHEMFSYVDGFTISFKKDGLVNMGGGIFIKNNALFMKKYPSIGNELMNHQIMTEGHPTYGGMSGRDIMTLCEGLRTITIQEYLDYRISQVNEFGEGIAKLGIPVVTPIGGHAVYLDMNRFFKDTKMKQGDFGGIAFTAILLAKYGHRACELGNFAFGSYDPKTKKETFPEVNFVRFAVPRLRYEKQDLDAVIKAIKEIYDHRKEIPGVEVIFGKELALRHFKARFKFKD